MSRPATARLFVAVELPSAAREELVLWARAALATLDPARSAGERPARVLESESLHLTLCFLGSRRLSEVETIAAALTSCAAPADELEVGAPLRLPPRRPRTLAVEVHDRSGALERAQRLISRTIAEVIEWTPERRRFRAHITVARMRAPSARERTRSAPSLPATPALRFRPAGVALYRSWLSPAGASYEIVARSALPAAREHRR